MGTASTRRAWLLAVAACGAMGLTGCQTTTPAGSAGTAMHGGPGHDASGDDSYGFNDPDSARTGGFMLVALREEDAPTTPLTVAMLPVTVDGETITPAEDGSAIEWSISPASTSGQREARTFDLPPGTYVLARIDAGTGGLFDISRADTVSGSSSGVPIPVPMPTSVALVALAIGFTAKAIKHAQSGDGDSKPVKTDNTYRRYFARHGKILTSDAMVFTVEPGKVTYIGDFQMRKIESGTPRVIEYRFDADTTSLLRPPVLPVGDAVIRRPELTRKRFYLRN